MTENLICHCFHYTMSDLEEDVMKNKKSTIEEQIKAEKQSGACECATKNPSGK